MTGDSLVSKATNDAFRDGWERIFQNESIIPETPPSIKDFVGRDVTIGQYFAYPLMFGSSSSMALYQLTEIRDDGGVKALKINESYGFNPAYKYRKWQYDYATGEGTYIQMTPEEIDKVNNKRSTLRMFSERACLVDYAKV